LLLMSDEIDPETGEIRSVGAFKLDKVESNIDDKLFESYHDHIANRIRKANKAFPKILLEYDESKLGTTSGEAVLQAVNFYNAMTADDRSHLSRMFAEVFKHSDNALIAANDNWNITP